MKQVKDLHKKWLKDPEYKKEYNALEEEFDFTRVLLQARLHANLTQAQIRGKAFPSTV